MATSDMYTQYFAAEKMKLKLLMNELLTLIDIYR